MRVSVGFCGLLMIAGPALAETATVERGPVPAWVSVTPPLPVPADASGALFVRRQDIELHLTGARQEQYTGYRFKILQPAALEAGNVAISWKPTAGAPIVHSIKVYRDGQTIDVLKTASFEVLRREEQLEASMISGILTAILRVPDLRVGDELEVEATVFSSDPTLGNKTAGVLFLSQSPPSGRYHLGLSWEGARAPLLRSTSDFASSLTRGPRSIDVRLDNPAVRVLPADAPGRFQWQRSLEYSDFADWATLSRQFASLYGKASTLGASSPLRAEAQRIAAAQSDPLGRASAALKLVQQNVRYVYVGLNSGNLTPTAADETWQRRYGDCKGKTALLLALLGQLGIEAEPVLVNTTGNDDGFDQRLAGPHLFDHVLVRARIAGKTYWLDGTLPAVARPSEQPIIALSNVLPLTARGSMLEHLAFRPAPTPDEITLTEIDARAGFDKPARLVVTTIHRGLDGLKEQVQYSVVSQAQLLAAFKQNAVGDYFQSVEDVRYRYDERAGASVLTLTGTTSTKWENGEGESKSLALPGGGFSPPERRVRDAGQDATAPFARKPSYTCHATTVRLPTGTLPREWSSKDSYDTRLFGENFHRAWQLRDGAIRMVRGSRVEQTEISPAIAARDNGRIPSFDNSMGYIFYTPKSTTGRVGAGEAVPATDEIDWTASNVPCASALANTASAK